LFFEIDKGGEITGFKVKRDYSEDSPLLVEVIQKLLDGPVDSEEQKGLITLIPSGTKLLSCSFFGSTLYLNLNNDFLYNKYGSLGYELQLSQIIETLKEFPINEVQILIEGKIIEYLDFGKEHWIGSPLSVNPEADVKIWLAKQKEMEEEIRNIFITERKIYTPVLVFFYYTEKLNSISGVNCSIQLMNISDKRIKYVYFTVTPYNRVDDIAYSETDRQSTTELEVVDYISPNESYHAEWKDVWYNSTIAYMKIDRIRVVFDDNNTSTIESQDTLDKTILTPKEYEQFSLFIRTAKGNF
jgi:hypothetical protein